MIKRLFRIATLLVPSWLAWWVAFSVAQPGDLTRVVKLTLGPLWALLASALLMRTMSVLVGRAEKRSPAPILAQIDVLTSAGAALAWTSAFAIIGAVWLGWASLAVVGLLGTALFHVVVLFTFIAVRGDDPMRAASIARTFMPEVATEGDDVTEQLRFNGARIPIGFRLFTSGRVGPRWATCRHVLDAAESGAEVVLESQVGPAVRGEHDVEPLEIWLQDTFGLCRSLRVQVGAMRLTVLPRLREAEPTSRMLDRGQGPNESRPSNILPTEGQFRLREYQHGDDVRRIHWVRSIAAREIIVRLPDEVPPDRPRVRLVLDTFFPDLPLPLATDAQSEMLDSIVSVWLAVAKSLAESGARVTLVTAVPQGETVGKTRLDLSLRTPNAALRLGAQVAWQSKMTVDQLLTDEATFVVSRAVLVQPPANDKVRWIVVLPTGITAEPPWTSGSGARFRFPIGSSENRWTLRRRAEQRMALARRDHRWVLGLRGDVARPPPGSFFAAPGPDGPIRVEALK